MEPVGNMNLWGLAVIIAAILICIVLSQFSPEARKRRRRRRNHTPVITTVRRPMVKFCVRTRRA
jgi:hypothetical protein